MEIRINHCRYAPSWNTLQTLIQEATNEPHGLLTKIDRVDGGCDYRGTGKYNLLFSQSNQTALPITLIVEPV